MTATTLPLTRTMRSACAKMKTVHCAHLERNGAIVPSRNHLQLFLLLKIAFLLLRLFSVPFVPTQSNVDNPRRTISATIAENTDTGNSYAQRLRSSPAPPVLALTNRSLENFSDIFNQGKWGSSWTCAKLSFEALANRLPETCLKSKAENTRTKYSGAFNR